MTHTCSTTMGVLPAPRQRPGSVDNTYLGGAVMAHRTCSIEGCANSHYGRGWCRAHYLRWARHGDPLAGRGMRGRREEYFWSRVHRGAPSECWEWAGPVNEHGYGQTGRSVAPDAGGLAHRIAYWILVGPVPDGLVLDHLCRNRRCVNPGHLEPVTQRENVLRGRGPVSRNAAKTHCPKGHPYDEANTYWTTSGGRQCKTCHREAERLRRAEAKKEAAS